MTRRHDMKLWRKVILRGLGAVFFGWVLVSAGVVLLSAYGVSADKVPLTVLSKKTAKFPENEKMLNDVTARLAREGEALSKVEPAAGSLNKSK